MNINETTKREQLGQIVNDWLVSCLEELLPPEAMQFYRDKDERFKTFCAEQGIEWNGKQSGSTLAYYISVMGTPVYSLELDFDPTKKDKLHGKN